MSIEHDTIISSDMSFEASVARIETKAIRDARDKRDEIQNRPFSRVHRPPFRASSQASGSEGRPGGSREGRLFAKLSDPARLRESVLSCPARRRCE